MLPNSIFRRWQHSYEEDAGDVQAYRPFEYPFPPARGRTGIEFRPDGQFVRWVIGPGDAPEAVPARWREQEENSRVVVSGAQQQEETVLELVECTDEVLRVRQVPAS